MPDGEDWLLRPVCEKMCMYESLLDCTLGMEDLAKMNDFIDVRDENTKRFRKAQEK